MPQSMVTRNVKETFVTAMIYHVDSKDIVTASFFVPGWHPDPGGRKLIKAARKYFAGTDTVILRIDSCRCGYSRYELPLSDFKKCAMIRHVDKEHQEYTE